MKRSVYFLLGAAMALLAPAASQAQKIQLRSVDQPPVVKFTPAEKAARQKAFALQYPLLAKRHELKKPANAPFQEMQTRAPLRQSFTNSVAGKLRAATSAPVFWDIAIYDAKHWEGVTQDNLKSFQGIYQLTADANADTELLLQNSELAFSGGSGIQNGVYYHLSANLSLASMGYIFVYRYAYDISTWEPAEGNDQSVTDFSLIATETAQATDGTTYGQFYNKDLSATEYGVIDYAKLTRTTFGESSQVMVALGVTSDNRLYGIGVDGNLYQISTTDGKETLIGATGVTVTDEDGGYYSQTGEIDPHTNAFYWQAIDGQGNSALYTVDLATGAATKIADQGDYMAYDMLPEGKVAEDGAPARVGNLTASFPNGATSGTVNFTMPTETYGGAALTGNLSYQVAYDTDTVEGTAAAGAPVSVSLTNVSEGNVSFSVVTSNAAGTSPRSKVSAYIGYDVPEAPATVTLKVDDGNKVTVVWDRVTKGLHGGYVDIDNMSYNVYRLTGTDTVQVANHTKDTTLTETITDTSLKNYVYAVVALNGEKAGDITNSNGVVIGNAIEPPYFEDFLTTDAFSLYDVVDNNHDGQTWSYAKMSDYTYPGSAYYEYSSQNNGDDWLITPPIQLKAGRDYIVSFMAAPTRSDFAERLEVKYGKANTVDAMTSELMPATLIDSQATHSYTIKVDEDGKYYFGFHAVSDADKYRLYLDSISIQTGALTTSPAAPTVKVTPGANGALTATVDITAPAKTIDGSDLTAIDSIVVRRDGNVLRVLTGIQPGATTTFTDNVPADGNHSYAATAFLSGENGQNGEARTYVGLDQPQAPRNVTATDNGTSVTINYELADKGVNGGYVDNASMVTYLYNIDSNGYIMALPSDSAKGGAPLTFTFNTNTGDANLKTWALSNINRIGESGFVGATLPVGTPAVLPYRESAPGGQVAYNWWINSTDASGSSNTWNITTTDAADGDGGSFIYRSAADSIEGSVNSYKIAIKGAANPMLVFSDKVAGTSATTNSRVQVLVQTPDGKSTEIYSQPINSDRAWAQHKVSLADYKSNNWIIVSFNVITDKAPVAYGLDKILVQQVYANDLAVNLTVPASVSKGQDINGTVTVSNEGDNDAAAYMVNVYEGNELISSYNRSNLASFASASIPVKWSTSSLEKSNSMNVRAEVVFDGDLFTANNTTSGTVGLTQNDYASPTGLTAVEKGDSVSLAWTAPQTTIETVVDSFESYKAWDLDKAGSWKFVNGNGSMFGSLSSEGTEPNVTSFGAYEIWHPLGVFNSGQGLDPHSGQQCLASVYKISADGEGYADGDDWAISPVLSGEAQTVSFWVNNYAGSNYGTETFQVLASTTTNDTTSFTQVGSNYTQASGTWTQVSVDLPAGTKYFAIRRITPGDDQFIFFIDDVTYDAGSLDVTGFNVYRDNSFLGNTASTAFGDLLESTTAHTYSVTAVYSDGSESLPVTVDFVASGIENVEKALGADSYDVYTLGGQLLRKGAKSLNGLKKGVHIINGKKVLVK